MQKSIVWPAAVPWKLKSFDLEAASDVLSIIPEGAVVYAVESVVRTMVPADAGAPLPKKESVPLSKNPVEVWSAPKLLSELLAVSVFCCTKFNVKSELTAAAGG